MAPARVCPRLVSEGQLGAGTSDSPVASPRLANYALARLVAPDFWYDRRSQIVSAREINMAIHFTPTRALAMTMTMIARRAVGSAMSAGRISSLLSARLGPTGASPFAPPQMGGA